MTLAVFIHPTLVDAIPYIHTVGIQYKSPRLSTHLMKLYIPHIPHHAYFGHLLSLPCPILFLAVALSILYLIMVANALKQRVYFVYDILCLCLSSPSCLSCGGKDRTTIGNY